MTKAPIPGSSKTRLIPPLTPLEAAALSACFLRDTAANIAAISAGYRTDSIAAYTPAGGESVFAHLLPRTFKLLAQRGQSFGEKLFGVVEDLKPVGYKSVCLINADSPTLPRALLQSAVSAITWLSGFSVKSNSRANVLLLLLGGMLLVLYRVGLGASGTEDIKWFIELALVQSTIYFIAAWIVFRTVSARSTFLLVIIFAILFRLSILFSPPYLSDDIYRYVWDGRVQAAGVNPYRYVPAAPELTHLRDNTIYPKINRREYAQTIYPPVAEFLFFVTTRVSESVTWMKLTMLGFELIAAWAIVKLLASFGLSPQRLLLYSWHPLIVWEFAGSGHVDAVAIAMIALAFLAARKRKEIGAGFVLAFAALTKLFPVILLPAVYKRWGWKLPLALVFTVVISYLPYLSVGPQKVFGFLPGYVREQGLISGEQYYLLHLAKRLFGIGVPAGVFLAFALVIIGAIAIRTIFRNRERDVSLGGAMALATATTVLFAPHYTWYFAWLVPFLCFIPLGAVSYLTAASFILYGSWLGDVPDQMFRLNSYLYMPFLLIGAIEFLTRKLKLQIIPLKRGGATSILQKQRIDHFEG